MRLACLGLLCALAACHDHDHDAYATYQACFTDHTTVESLTVTEAIVVCCLDHPIAGMSSPVCGDTAAACVTYLTTNLTSGATDQEKMAACDEYIVQKGM
jgi:hypothetical protein